MNEQTPFDTVREQTSDRLCELMSHFEGRMDTDTLEFVAMLSDLISVALADAHACGQREGTKR